MLVLASGEGPTDIGKASGNCDIHAPGSWEPGPMAYFIDHVIQTLFHFEALGSAMWFLPEEALNRIARNIRPMTLGSHREFRKSAWTLLASAHKLAQEKGCAVLPILFRDTDGSRSQQKASGRWQEKHDSIAYCLDRTGTTMHVCPMLPNPKSEAWLLCALKNDYRDCALLEKIPGNDASPHSAKSQLRDCLGTEVTQEYLVDLIQARRIRPDAIDMPSYNVWKDDMRIILQNMDGLYSFSASIIQSFTQVTRSVRIENI